MNYQKLAQTLLRVLGIWLLVQGLQQIAAAAYMLVQMSNRAPSVSMSLWMTPVGAGLTLLLAAGLLFGSSWISKLIAEEPEKKEPNQALEPTAAAGRGSS